MSYFTKVYEMTDEQLKAAIEEDRKKANYADSLIFISEVSMVLMNVNFLDASKEEAFDQIEEAYHEWAKSVSMNNQRYDEHYNILKKHTRR